MSSEAPKKRGRKPGSTNKPTGPVGSRASSVRRNVTLDDYPAIQVEGGLFTVEHVRKVAKTEADKQSPTDYELPAGIDLKEEIGRSFRIATALWKDFDSARQGAGDKTQATERFVGQLLKDCFGFADIRTTEPKVIAEMPYPIGRTAHGKAVPVVIVGAHQGLDFADLALGDGHRKRTASQLTQEYLNAEDACLWAVCTNGLVIRLLRDSDSLTRQSYFEANIERILGEQLMADFAMLWLHAHASRLKPDSTGPAGCPLEIWHLAAQEEGSRVRDSLRIGVEKAMVELGSGFLEHRDGSRLREALRSGTLKLEEYHQQVLRLVYRMLFLFAVEDRKLLHPRTAKTEQVELYAEGYSLSRLRERSIKHCHDRYDDIWDSLKVTFRGLATGQDTLGLPPLGSLFAEEQCAELAKSNISNRRLLNAVRAIAWFRENDALVPVNYKSMGTEELGSVYESLLELTPAIDESGKGFGFIKADEEEGKGNSRKTSGSYYTPDSLVQQLLDTTLDPVVADRLKGKSTKEDKEKAILSVTVIDPACGSGHFLLGAARRLAEKLASIRAEGGEATDYRRALRDVIASCIHGVDRNPMAIQLAKVALWLEGYVADKPLSFLDHHLVVGDSILSIIDLDMATKGIPDEAYEVITGDDKAVARALKARNKTSRDSELKVKQATMDLFGGTKVDMGKSFAKIDVLSDDTLDGVAKKVGQLEIFMKEAQADWRVTAAKLYLGAYLLPKVQGVRIPTSSDILAAMNGERLQDVLPAVGDACAKAKALIWPLAFPHVFERGGFAVILGNPPWEKITLKEREFFATRSPEVAAAINKTERQRCIDRLKNSHLGTPERSVYEDFLSAKRGTEAISAYAHDSNRFPLTGRGDVNLYALFAENFLRLLSSDGRAGLVAPTGIATDMNTADFFGQLISSRKLASFLSFENKKRLFRDVQPLMKFSLVTIGESPAADFAFMLHAVDDLKVPGRMMRLTDSDFALLNPNTKTSPILRSEKDLQLVTSIYRRIPILKKEVGEPSSADWAISYRTVYHMVEDADCFSNAPGVGLAPLYESKMFQIYDHRFSQFQESVSGEAVNDDDSASSVTYETKQDPAYDVRPRYWVSDADLVARLSNVDSAFKGPHSEATELLYSAYLTHAIGNLRDKPVFSGAHFKWAKNKGKDLGIASFKDLFGCMPEASEGFIRDLLLTSSYAEAQSVLLRFCCPRWMFGWRDITDMNANIRTLICSVYPFSGSANTIFNMSSKHDAPLMACLIAQLSSIPCDYVVRTKVGGTHLTYSYMNQIPVLPPSAFGAAQKAFILPRVLELVYTTFSLRPFYDEIVGLFPSAESRSGTALGTPYPFNDERRALVKAELDAYVGHLWGLSRADMEYILYPQSVMGPAYPSETFRGLREVEIKRHGEYRTQRLVLEAWDRIVEPLRRGQV
jgi:hypothetical protein